MSAKEYHYNSAQIWKCYRFAQEMWSNQRSNMIKERTSLEIFRDDFRGKLGEVALNNYINYYVNRGRKNAEAVIQSGPDFTVAPLRIWDSFDLQVNNKNINVKSVKGNGHFLMIETQRYNADGTFAYQNNDGTPTIVDAYVLVSVDITPEITRSEDMEYKDINELRNNGREIKYKILGGIRHADFWKKKHFAPQGMVCDYKNLSKVCEGKTPEMYESLFSKTGKEALAKDNYILKSTELLSVKDIL